MTILRSQVIEAFSALEIENNLPAEVDPEEISITSIEISGPRVIVRYVVSGINGEKEVLHEGEPIEILIQVPIIEDVPPIY